MIFFNVNNVEQFVINFNLFFLFFLLHTTQYTSQPLHELPKNNEDRKFVILFEKE